MFVDDEWNVARCRVGEVDVVEKVSVRRDIAEKMRCCRESEMRCYRKPSLNFYVFFLPLPIW